MSKSSSVRVRFAPSPTGYLHVGGARTALYNFLYARHHGGQFILRIEDTDLARSTEEAMRKQMADLRWLGLNWDEGPDPETLVDRGPHGPYRQSQRTSIYREYAEKLVDRGLAYYDFRPDAELEALREELLKVGKPPHVGPPKDMVGPHEARARVARGEPAAIRFHVKEVRDYLLQDLVRGEVRFPSDMVGDFVCIRSNGMPVYNFCCVVDDALMEISHVFRAEEHLSNTVRQLILYEALGFSPPAFGHLSFMVGHDRQKLSKRHGATSCDDFRKRGYLAEALNNFILLCGWSSPSGEEILSREAVISEFTETRFNPAPSVFDEQKLQWMNSVYLRAMSDDALWSAISPFLSEAGVRLSEGENIEWRARALSVFRSSMTLLSDAVTLFEPLCDEKFAVAAEAAEVMRWPETARVLKEWVNALSEVSDIFISVETFQALETRVKERAQVKGKHLFQPIRVAVIGKPSGAELKILVPLIPRQSLLKRAQSVVGQIEGQAV